MFLPAAPKQSEQKQKRKPITSHRLLTSHEVIKQKLELETKKRLKQSKGVKRLLPVVKKIDKFSNAVQGLNAGWARSYNLILHTPIPHNWMGQGHKNCHMFMSLS